MSQTSNFFARRVRVVTFSFLDIQDMAQAAPARGETALVDKQFDDRVRFFEEFIDSEVPFTVPIDPNQHRRVFLSHTLLVI